jgi:hypothetical protein
MRVRALTLRACLLQALFTLAFTAMLTSNGYAASVAGSDVADSITVSDTPLILNGAGLRTRLGLKLYVGALYLEQPDSRADSIIEADRAMAISLKIRSRLLNRKKMKKALRDGFEKSTGGDTAALQQRIEKMLAMMDSKIVKGDHYLLAYTPGQGTTLSRNGESADQPIEGLDFKQALFGIWLSDNPAQASLKKAMLGG